MTLGELLRRKKAEYEFETIEQMAFELEVEPGYLYRLMNSKRMRLSANTKYRICLVLDVDPKVLEEVVG